jgi:osmoprotectant transport system permease protein
MHRNRHFQRAAGMTWFLRNWDQVAIALGQHVTIVLTALVIAFAIALPVGIVAARNARVFAIAITVTGFLYTIPTLAFLALLIPLVGLGRTNAIIAMVAFSLVVLIRNVATGIRGVAADVIDAARGMGMSERQVLLRVELPLASPVIVAGLRVAAVTVISVTVVAAYVNAGGLGTLIFNGIAGDHAPKIWSGALTACALAIAVDGLLALTERHLLRSRVG